MSGGTIQSCKAGTGGSAISVDGTCNLSGGGITGNTDTSSLNCAVYLHPSGSGVTQISYTMTPVDADGSPDGSKAETKTASVSKNGGVAEAKITFEEEFKGNITITCSDVLGNPADSVTISVDGSGIIVKVKSPKEAPN